MFSEEWHLQKLLSLMCNVYISMSLNPLFDYQNIMDSAKAHSGHRPLSVHGNHKCIPKLHKEAEHCQNNCCIVPPSYYNFFWFPHIPLHTGPTNVISHARPKNPTTRIPSVNCWEERPSEITKNLLLKKESWDFPGGTVVKTPWSQCRGPGFNPWSGN